MNKKELHPSIQKFKGFVTKNPKLIQDVRKGKYTWQELYEDWVLLGEEDPRWFEFREDEKKETEAAEQKTDLIGQIVDAVKKMDANQIDHHIKNLSQALSSIQGVISQFQSSKLGNTAQKKEQPPHPFMFRKD